MFFNRNVSNTRRVASADGTLSPRFARLVRESWWLLVVAFLVYLALILASYTSTDPGSSFSVTGAPLGNRGGPARAVGLNGGTSLVLVLLAVGRSLLVGVSGVKVTERIGAGIEALSATLRRRREAAVDRRIGEEAAAEREHVVEHLREVDFEREP